MLTRARGFLFYIAVPKLKLSCVEVARQLNIDPSVVSREASRRGKDVKSKIILTKFLKA
jgi:hypothetical protein